MSLPIKLGVGTLALGSAVGAGYAGISYFSKEDKKEEPSNTVQPSTAINELVNKEYEYTLLNTSEGADNKDGNYWDTNWKAYKSANANKDKDLLGLESWNKTDPGNSVSALKKRCKELATEKVSSKSKDLYQNVTTYCGRSITVEDQARRKNLTILNTAPTGNDTKIWQSRKTKSSDLKNSLDLLEIIGDKVTEEGIRTGCETAKTKNKKEAKLNYQKIYDAYVQVCTKQPEDTQV